MFYLGTWRTELLIYAKNQLVSQYPRTRRTRRQTGDGESVYQKACKVCHDAGVANAPKLGDSAAWAPRIEKGDDAMFDSVKNGLNAMPPKGACMNCSDTELRSAVEYMLSQGS